MSAEPVSLHLEHRARLEPGQELTILGLGRCRYQGADIGADGEIRWLNVTHPKNGGTRSVTPDRVLIVHRKTKLR